MSLALAQRPDLPLVTLHLGVGGEGLSSGAGPGLAPQPLPASSYLGDFPPHILAGEVIRTTESSFYGFI